MNTAEHEGWHILTRAMLHVWQCRDCHDSLTIAVLDHCRRVILQELYPTDEHIAGLLKQSTSRMAKEVNSNFGVPETTL